jgi:hypothetical protein
LHFIPLLVELSLQLHCESKTSGLIFTSNIDHHWFQTQHNTCY